MAVGDLTATRGTYSDYECNVFDGVDDYVEIPHNAAQLGANLSNGFTISVWINARSAGENAAGTILEKASSFGGANGFSFQTGINKDILFSINDGTFRTSANNSAPFGSWTHGLITVSSGANVTCYIGGVVSGIPGTTNAISGITNTDAMILGNMVGAKSRTFDGSIRSVKMWNRVLTTAEIALDYDGTLISNGLIHNFKLGGDYADYGDVGVTATNSGSYANKRDYNSIVADVSQVNLALNTGKLIILPKKLGKDCVVMGINRAAA